MNGEGSPEGTQLRVIPGTEGRNGEPTGQPITVVDDVPWTLDEISDSAVEFMTEACGAISKARGAIAKLRSENPDAVFSLDTSVIAATSQAASAIVTNAWLSRGVLALERIDEKLARGRSSLPDPAPKPARLIITAVLARVHDRLIGDAKSQYPSVADLERLLAQLRVELLSDAPSELGEACG